MQSNLRGRWVLSSPKPNETSEVFTLALVDEILGLGPVGAIGLFLFIGIFSYKLWQADRGSQRRKPSQQELEEKAALELSEKLRKKRAAE